MGWAGQGQVSGLRVHVTGALSCLLSGCWAELYFVRKESRAQRHCPTCAKSHSSQQGTGDQVLVPRGETADGEAGA